MAAKRQPRVTLPDEAPRLQQARFAAEIDASARPSPARDLQDALAERLNADRFAPPHVKLLPGAVRLGVAVGGSGLLWTALISVVRVVCKAN